MLAECAQDVMRVALISLGDLTPHSAVSEPGLVQAWLKY